MTPFPRAVLSPSSAESASAHSDSDVISRKGSSEGLTSRSSSPPDMEAGLTPAPAPRAQANIQSPEPHLSLEDSKTAYVSLRDLVEDPIYIPTATSRLGQLLGCCCTQELEIFTEKAIQMGSTRAIKSITHLLVKECAKKNNATIQEALLQSLVKILKFTKASAAQQLICEELKSVSTLIIRATKDKPCTLSITVLLKALFDAARCMDVSSTLRLELLTQATALAGFMASKNCAGNFIPSLGNFRRIIDLYVNLALEPNSLHTAEFIKKIADRLRSIFICSVYKTVLSPRVGGHRSIVLSPQLMFAIRTAVNDALCSIDMAPLVLLPIPEQSHSALEDEHKSSDVYSYSLSPNSLRIEQEAAEELAEAERNRPCCANKEPQIIFGMLGVALLCLSLSNKVIEKFMNV